MLNFIFCSVTMGTQSNPPSNLRSKPTFSQYVSLRQRLDDLGYNSYLSNDSVPLVDKLLTDLLQYKDLCMGSHKCCHTTKKKSAPTLLSGSNTVECNSHEGKDQSKCSQQKSRDSTPHLQVEALQLENNKLLEQLSDFKFVLDQNTCVIQKLKKENDSKAALILQLQNGLAKESQGKTSRPNIAKDEDLPSANLSKIQALYNRILSASDNPAIIDWVKAAETKINSLERELENTSKALDASHQTNEQYRNQMLEYENKLHRHEKLDKNKGTQNYAHLKCRMEQKERENKELQAQLSEAVRKQHEAMSRAIMLAGDRTHNREAPSKHPCIEKKMVGLESERNVLKQMLCTTQKERDELMKEVHRLHSQESALMNEIRTLVGDETSQGPKGKNVRFQTNNKNVRAADSGVDTGSAASSNQDTGGGRNRENWLRRLAEQRQSYYDNVHQLLNFMKNRQELTRPNEQRPSSQLSGATLSSASQMNNNPASQPGFPQPIFLQQPQINVPLSNVPMQQRQRNMNQPLNPYQQPLLNFQPPSQQPATSGQPLNPQTASVQQSNVQPAQYQVSGGGMQPQQQSTFAQPNIQWNAQPQGTYGQANLTQQKVCVCGGLPVGPQSFSQSQAQPGYPLTYQLDPSGGQLNYLQSYQYDDPQLQNFSAQQAQFMGTQANFQSSGSYNTEHDPLQRISRPTTTNVQDVKTQTDSDGTAVFTPTAEELSKLPSEFQTWAQAIMDEKKVLKEKNSELRLELDESSQATDGKMNEIIDKLQKAEEYIGKLQSELDNTNAKARAAEQGLQAERNNLQQLRLDIDEADGNAESLTKKFVEKSTQLEAAKQRIVTLEQNSSALQDQVTSLKNQIDALQSQNQRPNPAVQKLLDEVEGRNQRILQLEKQLSAKQEAIHQKGNEVESTNSRLRELEQDLQSEKTKVLQLQQDIDNCQNKIKAAERDLSSEKNKIQQLQNDISNADSNASSLTKKMMEKSSQLDASKQRCNDLEQQVSRLEEQVGSLQGQLRSSQVQRSQAENDHRQLHDELDACKSRINQLERQLSSKQDTINMLENNVQTFEHKILMLEKDVSDKSSQAELNRRQNDRVSGELEKSKIDSLALRQENERLVGSLAQLRGDIDRERKGADDLRREIQSYVNHVRQVESILARKDEEKDALLKQFQVLANETSNFEAERENMERSVRSQQQEVDTLQSELTTVRRRLGELEQLYSQQKRAGAQAELQTDDLLRRLSALERDLRDARGDKTRLEQQLATANDQQQRLAKQLEKLRAEAAQADSTTHQMENETARLHEDVRVLEQRLSKERETARNLESIVTVLRQERSQQETQMRTMSQDLTRLHHREILLQEELANAKAELCAVEGKAADLTRENQRLKQEVLQERFEREKSRQEYKRINLSHSPLPLASYNASPAPPGALHDLSAGMLGTTPIAGPSGASTARGSPRRRVTVAARFTNNATQT